ncbi:MAG: EamA family transporter [Vampirovibrio sp.]|nr:EamA family transporter [Vampirovibrio sp.]
MASLQSLHWIPLALLALLSMGLGNFILKLATHLGYQSLHATLLVFLATGLMGLILWVLYRPTLSNLTANIPGAAMAVLAGILLAIGVWLLILAYAHPQAKTGVATALLNSNFALVVLLSYVFLQETLTLKQFVGLGAVLAGILLLV